jgi:hypothetical protein
LVAISDEPWRLAESRLNPENGASLFAAAGAAYRSRRAIGAWPTHAGPAGVGQGRQPAKPGAHRASLDGRRLVRQRSFQAILAWLRGDVLSGALDCESDGIHCVSRKQRLSAIRKLGMGIQSERTLLKLPKSGLHLVLTQCADIDSRANRPSKPCLLLSCYQAVEVSCLVHRAPFYDKLRSGKNREEHRKSRFHADFVQSICWLF